MFVNLFIIFKRYYTRTIKYSLIICMHGRRILVIPAIATYYCNVTYIICICHNTINIYIWLKLPHLRVEHNKAENSSKTEKNVFEIFYFFCVNRSWVPHQHCEKFLSLAACGIQFFKLTQI